jgi:hypothetical protein
MPTVHGELKIRIRLMVASDDGGRISSEDRDFFDLQRYLGQMPSSVLSQHYDMVDTDRLRKIADVAQGLARTESG